MSEHVLTDDEAQAFIDAGVMARELPFLAFPDADEDFAEWFLWEKTPFPMAMGVHDLTDAIAEAFTRGPRCDDILERGQCRSRVRQWGQMCHLHTPTAPTRPSLPASASGRA